MAQHVSFGYHTDSLDSGTVQLQDRYSVCGADRCSPNWDVEQSCEPCPEQCSGPVQPCSTSSSLYSAARMNLGMFTVKLLPWFTWVAGINTMTPLPTSTPPPNKGKRKENSGRKRLDSSYRFSLPSRGSKAGMQGSGLKQNPWRIAAYWIIPWLIFSYLYLTASAHLPKIVTPTVGFALLYQFAFIASQMWPHVW